MRGFRVLILVGVATLGLPAFAGPGVHKTLVLSPEGFSSLELRVFWSGEPVSLSLGGRWESVGFAYGKVGGSFSLESFGISAELGVAAVGTWEVSLSGWFSQAPLSLSGELSFSGTGIASWSVGAILAWDPLSLQGSLRWEGDLSALVAGQLNLGRLSLQGGVHLSPEGIAWAKGGFELSGELGAVGFGVDFYPPTRELLLSTEFDVRSEHISLGFAAVWSPWEQRASPAALSAEREELPGILRFLKELRVEASVAAPKEGPLSEREELLALISAPKGTTFVVGQEIRFSARGSRSLAGPLDEFLWHFGDGTRAWGMEVSHKYTAPGIYQVKLLVRDVHGRFAQAERLLRVIPPELSPDFTWEPKRPTILEEVRFVDLSRGEIASWHWNFGDGETSNAREPTHRYKTKGTFSVTLTVTDRYGNVASVTKELSVVNIPPLADPGGPYQGLLYQEIVFSAAGSHDPDGKIVEYIWDFGDGTQGRGATVLHVYRKPGTFQVCLTVVDNDGAEGRACTTAQITYPKQGGGP